MRRVFGFVLVTAVAVTALTACMSDNNGSARKERRSAALVEGGRGAANMELTVTGLTPAGKAIDVVSYSWGVARPVQFEDLHITKAMDETSPLLARGVATGAIYTSAVLKLFTTPAGGRPANYATYTLENVLIKSVQVAGQSQGNTPPMEEVSLTYETIVKVVTMPQADGTLGPPVRFGWNLTTGRPI